MTRDEFPQRLRSALSRAAKTLGTSLVALGYPNGGKDAVFAEANLVAHVTSSLLGSSPPFLCYAEASHTGGRRIDLLACDGSIALAFEAKKFGDIESACGLVLNDMARLDSFAPSLSPLADGSRASNWWGEAKQRWAVVLIGAHVDQLAHDVWLEPDSVCRNEMLANGIGYGRSNKRIRNASRLLELLQDIRDRPRSTVGAESICAGSPWQDCQDAWLLWAAYVLSPADSDSPCVAFA